MAQIENKITEAFKRSLTPIKYREVNHMEITHIESNVNTSLEASPQCEIRSAPNNLIRINSNTGSFIGRSKSTI